LEVLHERLETLQNVLRRAEIQAVNRAPAEHNIPLPSVQAVADNAVDVPQEEVVERIQMHTNNNTVGGGGVSPTEEDGIIPITEHSLWNASSLDETAESKDDNPDSNSTPPNHNPKPLVALNRPTAGEANLSVAFSRPQLSRAVEQIELMKRFIEIRREPSAATRAELQEAMRPLERRVMMNDTDGDLRFRMSPFRGASPNRLMPPPTASIDSEELLAEQELQNNIESAWRDCGSDVSLDSEENDSGKKQDQAENAVDLNGVNEDQGDSEHSLDMVSMLGDLLQRELDDDDDDEEEEEEDEEEDGLEADGDDVKVDAVSEDEVDV